MEVFNPKSEPRYVKVVDDLSKALDQWAQQTAVHLFSTRQVPTKQAAISLVMSSMTRTLIACVGNTAFVMQAPFTELDRQRVESNLTEALNREVMLLAHTVERK